ncbi:cytochrome P450 [Serendipita vermifera]|nr:cytochrome P450 [Serendipita vermifera]
MLTISNLISYGDQISKSDIAIAVGAVAGSIVLYRLANTPEAKARRAGARLPPGPKRDFIIGNLRNFPKNRWYETFTRWKQEFGDIVYANVLGKQIIVCNSLEVAEELMGKRANIYSARPYTIMLNKLMYHEWTPIFAQPGRDHTQQRKLFRQAIGPQSAHEYDRIIQISISNLLKTLITSEGDPFLPVSHEIGGVIIRCAYGDKVWKEHGEDMVDTNGRRSKLMGVVISRFWMVNVFPFLQYIPTWFPGAAFRRISIEGIRLGKEVRFEGFNHVERDLSNGIVDESLITKHINDPGISKDHLRDVVGSMYLAGSETTSVSITNFLYAMMMHPEIQKKLHDEMDDQIGGGRLPSMAEIERLQYFNTAWKESMRWTVTVPLGIAHVSTEDDVWNGYYIPKGSIMQCNIGCMLRDPRVFGDDADSYNPDRFLPECNPRANEIPDPSLIPFGFGKRICPGRHLAERIALMVSAAILSTYEIVPTNGKVRPRDLEFPDSGFRLAFVLEYDHRLLTTSSCQASN